VYQRTANKDVTFVVLGVGAKVQQRMLLQTHREAYFWFRNGFETCIYEIILSGTLPVNNTVNMDKVVRAEFLGLRIRPQVELFPKIISATWCLVLVI